MQTPLPQPYDITDVPYMAWVPGPLAWLAAAAGIILVAVAVWMRNNPRKTSSDRKIIDTMIAELQTSLKASSDTSLERASRIARRVASHILGRNLSELTSEELRASVPEGASPLWREIVHAVAGFEEIAYAPPSQQRNAVAQELGAKLARLIDDYRKEVRPR